MGGRADEDGLLTRAAGERRRLGRRRPWQERMRPQACCQEACCSDAVGSEGTVEWGETRLHQRIRSSSGEGSTWDAAARAHARAKRALWPRPEHARDVLGKMPMPSKGL